MRPVTTRLDGGSTARRALALSLALLVVGSVVALGGAPVGTAAAVEGGSDEAKITGENPSPVAPGETVTLNGSSNYSQPTYNWSLGNGETRNETQNVSAAYDEPGTYDVNLTVTNESSGETASHEIAIEVVALDVNASANDTTVVTGEDVQFNSTTSTARRTT